MDSIYPPVEPFARAFCSQQLTWISRSTWLRHFVVAADEGALKQIVELDVQLLRIIT